MAVSCGGGGVRGASGSGREKWDVLCSPRMSTHVYTVLYIPTYLTLLPNSFYWKNYNSFQFVNNLCAVEGTIALDFFFLGGGGQDFLAGLIWCSPS